MQKDSKLNLQAYFNEIEKHLMEDNRPSVFLEEFFSKDISHKIPFSMLNRLKNTKQSPTHHPEGSAWNHTMLVADYAAKLRNQSKNPRVYMWAVLLHDIGKPDATRIKNGKITAYSHDKIGEPLAREFLSNFELDDAFIESVCQLVRYHMNIMFVVKDMPFKDIEGVRKYTDVDELALVGFADRMGRFHADKQTVKKQVEEFKRIVKNNGVI